jgi:hypothetical protein
MNSPSNRRRGNASVRKAGNLPKRHNGPSQTGKAFPKTETAKTAKYQMHERDREQLHKVEAKYLKPTPQEVAVFKVRSSWPSHSCRVDRITNNGCIKADIIIAGKHLTPSGLEEPGAFNAIRKAHQVYVDYIDESDTIIVSAESISQLKDAVKAVQWLIHDRRLSHDLPATSFIIQKPLEAHDQTPISVVLGRRPCSIGAQKSMPDSADMSRIANNLVEPLRRDIVTSAERLMGIGKQLRARINFGRVNIRQKKKGLGNELSHTSFADFMKACSIRGGAGLATRCVCSIGIKSCSWLT